MTVPIHNILLLQLYNFRGRIEKKGLMLNITVFIKQVPDTDDVQWTAENNIDRKNTDSILNPLDRQALSAALKLKEASGAEIAAVSMGPDKALDVLKEAIAMGADDAALLSDSKFTGSDTCATSKVLAASIKEIFKNTDLILFGQSASDGETSQTGAQTAVRLGLPYITNVTEIIGIENGFVTAYSETETEKILYKVKLPAALCINNYVYKASLPDISGYIRAKDYNYKTYNIFELKLSPEETGIKGSPTYVSKVYRTDETRCCKMIDTNEALKIIKEAVYGS